MMNSLSKCLAVSFFACIIVSCSPTKKAPAQVAISIPAEVAPLPQISAADEDPFLANLFSNYAGLIDSALSHRKDWNVQIIYTQIDRSPGEKPALTTHNYNTTDGKYFYPASTVKLPVALLALQRLHELNIPGLTMHSPMVTEASYSRQTAVYNDPNTVDGVPSIAQYIKKILLVSDNDAYNRLFEFLGSGYINRELQKKGFTDAQVLHHLNVSLTEDENRHSNLTKFYSPGYDLVYTKEMEKDETRYPARADMMGNGYYSNGLLVNGPMNFSNKNRWSLSDMHRVITGLFFPEGLPGQQFDITPEDRRFVMQYMSQYPAESVYPSYDSTYPDAYAKFLLLGGKPGTPPAQLRIFNKSGDAYGQLIDAAYVVDYARNIEFILSAVIYCNSDGILNDDKYDYETIGLPFMQNLGKIIYDYESKRERKYKPDLSSVIFKYDK